MCLCVWTVEVCVGVMKSFMKETESHQNYHEGLVFKKLIDSN